MALPAEITLIPGYVFYARINWINTYWPLIIPDIAVPFGIFMLTQFFRSIPKELEEAAYMDGASRFRTYWSIALPLSRPALLTLAILQFQGAWNDYTKPLLFLAKAESDDADDRHGILPIPICQRPERDPGRRDV